jgi:hypothetical protein
MSKPDNTSDILDLSKPDSVFEVSRRVNAKVPVFFCLTTEHPQYHSFVKQLRIRFEGVSDSRGALQSTLDYWRLGKLWAAVAIVATNSDYRFSFIETPDGVNCSAYPLQGGSGGE